jgi:hypothetical protein
MDKGMQLILACKSYKAFSNKEFLIEQGIMELPRSLSFIGNFFCKITFNLQ